MARHASFRRGPALSLEDLTPTMTRRQFTTTDKRYGSEE